MAQPPHWMGYPVARFEAFWSHFTLTAAERAEIRHSPVEANQPQQAFDDPSDFFAGKGVDAVYLPFHKANEFLGMQGLPTFLCVDVMKRPQIEADVERYRRHLGEVFGFSV